MSELQENQEASEGKGSMFVLAFLGLIAVIFGFNFLSNNDIKQDAHEGSSSIVYESVDQLKEKLKIEEEKAIALGQKLNETEAELESLKLELSNKDKLIKDYEIKIRDIKILLYADAKSNAEETDMLILDSP
jgi:hypothetical protein